MTGTSAYSVVGWGTISASGPVTVTFATKAPSRSETSMRSPTALVNADVLVDVDGGRLGLGLGPLEQDGTGQFVEQAAHELAVEVLGVAAVGQQGDGDLLVGHPPAERRAGRGCRRHGRTPARSSRTVPIPGPSRSRGRTGRGWGPVPPASP